MTPGKTAPAATAPVAVPPPAPLPVPPAAGTAASATAAPVAGPAVAVVAEATIKVTPLTPTNLAVFRRSGGLWMVFDQALNAAAAEVSGPKKILIGSAKKVALPNGTALRFDLPDGMTPVVSRNGLSWTVQLTAQTLEPKVPEVLVVQPSPAKAQLQINMIRAGAPIPFADPDVGDTLIVVPGNPETGGFEDARQFADLELLPSAQGLVVRPLSDQVIVQPSVDMILLDTPGGLKLSAVQAPRGAVPSISSAMGSGEKPDRIFDFQTWQGPVKRQLQMRRREMEAEAATKREPAERVKAFLDLARLHFSYGYAQEALGYLVLATVAEPSIEASPEFRVLRGSVYALAGNGDASRDDLGLPPVVDQSDATLFRGLAFARSDRWAEAYPAFHSGVPLLNDYPDELFRPIALAAIEAALIQGDTGMAKLLLDKLEERTSLRPLVASALDYFRGRLLAAEGDNQGAAVLWKAAIAKRDLYYRSRAELALVQQGLAAGTLPAKEATERLEKLRLAWRGDDMEIQVLLLLGQQRVASGQIEDGLSALRIASVIVGDTPRGQEIRGVMSKTFNDLFEGNGADSLTPLRALTVFQDYKDLAPSVASQDRVIERLADRMVQIDLLDMAADLLTKQVAARTDATDKARLGARIAAIRLLDSKPDLALTALDTTEADKLPNDLKGERKLLRSRALSKIGKVDEAVALLRDDASPAADQLRVDIYWQARRWKQAADALARLAGPAPADGTPLEDNRAKLVLNRAVALALAEDPAGLTQLKNGFGPAMRQSKEAELFAVLTRSAGEGGGLNIEAIRAQVAEIDMFRGFLSSYRSKAGGGA